MGELNKAQQARASNFFQLFRVNPIGQRVLEDLQEAFGGSCFNENPYTMAYKEGRRDVLLYIQERLTENVLSENS